MHLDSAGDADLAAVGSILGDRARATVLLALGDGRALSASALAVEAGVAPSTASHHLARLMDSGLVTSVHRGRNRYYALAGPLVAELIEAVTRVAPARPVTSLRQGTRAHAIRYARSCYDHLAGRLGVALTDALIAEGSIQQSVSGLRSGPAGRSPMPSGSADGPPLFALSDSGAAALSAVGIELGPGTLGRCCLDWTEQRYHVAGPLGRALLNRWLELGWMTRARATRAVHLTNIGRKQLPEHFGVTLPSVDDGSARGPAEA
jgi:DNA-binding transcriptional ArsR family regulator